MTGIGAAHCRWLAELLATSAGDDEALEQTIAAHIAACPDCSSEETRLATLFSRYSDDDPPQLSDALETRLLDLICQPRGH